MTDSSSNSRGNGSSSIRGVVLEFPRRVVRFPPWETDTERDGWVERMERRIDTELDNLLRYGEIYIHQVAHREGLELAEGMELEPGEITWT